VTLIKFCGMTREQDVRDAVALGADAVGFVLWEGSPRCVAPHRLAALIACLSPSVVPVGVFVRPTRDDIQRGIDAGIRLVQLHGLEEQPTEASVETWIAVSLERDRFIAALPRETTVLLDAHDPSRHGGTGRTIDWSRAADVSAERRMVLAGGLTAANVADAIRTVRPYGVDVSSGIEDTPGVKNAGAMRAFAVAVRQADQ
jgi:phosphoribosylanthranilate isomerase